MQCRTPHDLYVEMALGQHPPGGFAGDRERLRQQIVEFRTVGDPGAELVGLGVQLGVGELFYVAGQGVDVVRHPPQALDHAAFTDAQQLRQHIFPWKTMRSRPWFREA